MQSSSIYMVQSLICLLPSGAFPYSQNNGFSSSHVGMWELDHKEGWMPKNWCFWTVVLKKTREGPLFLLDNFKEIKQLNPKGNQLWKLIGRTDAKEYKNTQKNCTKKDLHDQDNHNGVITHLEPDLLECEVKWALETKWALEQS